MIQRWRLMKVLACTVVMLMAAAWLRAQEPAKKAEAPAKTATAAAAPATTQPPVPTATPAPVAEKEFKLFAFTEDPAYGLLEKIALWVVLAIAVAGLLYAGGLVSQVVGADEGTEKMREVGAAIRQGANAYLAAAIQGDLPR